MDDARVLNRVMEALTWGGLFIWWGISVLPGFLPNGLDAAGTGIILLGLNVARSLRGIPTNGFSITLGILCLVWGALDMTRSVFHAPYKLPVFAILLIVLGVILLASALLRARRATGSSSGGA
jgi:hypothetical protein